MRAKEPFRITSQSVNCHYLQFIAPDKDLTNPLHLVPVTFTAGDEAGRKAPTIRIETDLRGAKPEVTAYAVVNT